MGRPPKFKDSLASELGHIFLADHDSMYGVRDLEKITGWNVSSIQAAQESKANIWSMKVQVGTRTKWKWRPVQTARDVPHGVSLDDEIRKWNREHPDMKRPPLKRPS